MSDSYNDNNGNGGFVMGLIAGAAIGAGLGMLFAPKAGAELRRQLSDQAADLASQAQDGARRVGESASDWADRGREMYGKAKDAAIKGANEARGAAEKGAADVQQFARDTKSTAATTMANALDSASAAAARRS